MTKRGLVWHVYAMSSYVIFLASVDVSQKHNTTYLAWLAAMGMADTLKLLGCKIKHDG